MLCSCRGFEFDIGEWKGDLSFSRECQSGGLVEWFGGRCTYAYMEVWENMGAKFKHLGIGASSVRGYDHYDHYAFYDF